MKNNDKCYARGCDHNNIDGTCMYGNTGERTCQVNCYNCKRNCKKECGDIACKKFVNKRFEMNTSIEEKLFAVVTKYKIKIDRIIKIFKNNRRK